MGETMGDSEQIVLDETEEIRNSSLRDLRTLLDHGDKKFDRTDDAFLLRFLRAEHYKIEESYAKLLKYQEWRDTYHLEKNLNAQSVAHILEEHFLYIIPGLDKNGRTIFVLVVKRLDFDKHKGLEYIRTLFYIFEKLLDDDHSGINGVTLIVDCYKMGWNNFNYDHLRNLADMLQKRFPIRIGHVFMCRQNKILSIAYNIFRPIIKLKYQERLIWVGQDFDLIERNVDRPLIPQELGGTIEFDLNLWIGSLIDSESETVTLQIPRLEWPLGAEVVLKYGGIFVEKLRPNSLGEKVGLREGDRISHVNGVLIRSVHDFQQFKSDGTQEITMSIRRVVYDVWHHRI